ncbi:MAG: acyclic terpene utilization AtuA family protein [Burkholderiaceae bacterium]
MSVTERKVRIGGACAFLGDTIEATPQLLQVPGINYLVYDFLAEATMAVLAQSKTKNPERGGYATDFVQFVAEYGAEIAAKKVKLVANAGGINPLVCADALRRVIAEQRLDLKVGVVTGDDVLDPARKLDPARFKDMYKSDPIPSELSSANAYFGGAPIARCLEMGADIVVTGRCVDSAMILGILLHEFGWSLSDFDRLAQGTLCGHLLECGAQVCGGLFTDWFLCGDWSRIGYPVAEVEQSGEFTIFKPEGTGGLVSFATVAEQMVYEIDDPSAYVVPDVICDFTDVAIIEEGAGRVRVRGARGMAPPDTFKVSAAYGDGYRCVAIHPVVGMEAGLKARKQAEALVQRVQRRLIDKGLGAFRSVYIELLGAEVSYGPHARSAGSREIISKIVVDHPSREALRWFALDALSPVTSMAPGSTSWHGGRPPISRVMRVASFLVPKREFPAQIDVEGRRDAVQAELFGGTVPGSGGYREEASVPEAGDERRVRLVDLAWARSGDKGDRFMIGVIARKPEYLPFIKRALSLPRLKQHMAHVFDAPEQARVDRYDIPGIGAVQLVFQDAQHGGQLASPRLDPLSKGMAQQLLELEVAVPYDLPVDSYEQRRAACMS